MSPKNFYFILIASFYLYSCASVEVKRPEHYEVDQQRIEKYGEGAMESQSQWERAWARLTGDVTGSDFSNINDLLWQTALEKVSFLPLSSVDKLSGTIITEWYNIQPDQKIKINLFVKNSLLDDTSLEIKIFEEKLIANDWVQMDRNTELEAKVKNSILNVARKLKTAQENL